MLTITPLVGIDGDDEFGRTVVISRDGNRIAVLSQKNVAVFERQSFNNVGKVVNNFIPTKMMDDSRDSSLAFSRHGSLVVTTAPSGTVQTFLDTSRFCMVPTGSLAVGTKSLFETFLDRQTCRNKDTLVENQQTCSQAVRYLGGRWEKCVFEDNLILTSFPSSNPSAIPSLAPSISLSLALSFSPSIEPSYYPTIIPFSIQPSVGLISQEPMSYAPSSYPSLRAGSLNPTASPTTMAHPLPLQSESPSYFSSDEPSSVTNTPSTSSEYNIFACHCDENGRCTNRSLKQTTPDLRICIISFLSSDIKLESSTLIQSDHSLPLVVGGNPIANETTLTCTAAQNGCVLQTKVSGAFFGIDRPNSVVIHGNILTDTELSSEFFIKVETSRDSSVPSNSSGLSVGAFWTILIICLALLFVALVRFYRRRRTTSNATSNDEQYIV